MTLELDRTADVRAGEELNTQKLEEYLHATLPQCSGPLTVEQFPHGHSNLTYLIRCGDAEFVLRRPPFGNQVQTAHDMNREYRVLSQLSKVYPPAPVPYVYCDDLNVLGAPFYVMERRLGIVLRSALPPGLSSDPAIMARLSCEFVDNLARLHAIDYRAAGLAELGKPAGYVARQVTGWTTRYANARTQDVPAMDQLIGWLNQNMPPESSVVAVIHNDYKFDNLLLDPQDLTRIVAVLDWEMATLGDPLMDLGTTLGYWVEAGDSELFKKSAMGPTMMPGCLTRREIVDRYCKVSGREAIEPLFYYCFGLFKIAVIIQQIYARFVRGHTQDARFAKLDRLVTQLCQQADHVLQRGSL